MLDHKTDILIDHKQHFTEESLSNFWSDKIIIVNSGEKITLKQLIAQQSNWTSMKAEEASIKSKPNHEIIQSIVSSSLSIIIGNVLTHPLETLKSKMQVKQNSINRIADFNSGQLTRILKSTWQTQGLRGFYPGVTVATLPCAAAFSLYLASYELFKNHLGGGYLKQHPSLNHLISGFMAEAVSCILWLPIDIVKQRLQVQSQTQRFGYEGPRQAVRQIIRSEGYLGLYRGFGATLAYFGPWSACFFLSFEEFKDRLVVSRSSPSLLESLLCSGLAGAVASMMASPLQLIKLRIQIDHQPESSPNLNLYGYRNLFDGLSSVSQKQGWLALFRGAGVRISHSVPNITLTMGIAEYIRSTISHVDSQKA